MEESFDFHPFYYLSSKLNLKHFDTLHKGSRLMEWAEWLFGIKNLVRLEWLIIIRKQDLQRSM